MGCGARPLLLAALLGVLSRAYEEPLPEDPMDDDRSDALARVRHRLDGQQPTAKHAVLMVTGPNELQWSQLTIPIWRAYCRENNYDFFLQEEALSADHPFEWTKPRVLLEIAARRKWKYVFVVDANSLPNQFHRRWDHVIRVHMRHKRYHGDKPGDRLVFCPWECEAEYGNALEDGACYGPQLSGCVFATKKPRVVRLLRLWYSKRTAKYFSKDQGVVMGFGKMKEQEWDYVYLRDVQGEIGRKGSTFMPTFAYDADGHGWNLRDQVFDFISGHKVLGRVANDEKRSAEKHGHRKENFEL